MAHPNSFVWYELMTTDADAAETFYSDVVGWRTQDAGMPGMRYTILSVGEAGVGGIMTIPPNACAAGARPGWIGYIGVDDVDATAGRVKQAGGTIHKLPEDIPGIGRFAVVADPQGASFVLFRGSSEQPPERPAPGVPGSPGWHELHAGEWQSAFAFYADLFGWTKAEAVDMGAMGTYQLFAAGAEPIGGMMTKFRVRPRAVLALLFHGRRNRRGGRPCDRQGRPGAPGAPRSAGRHVDRPMPGSSGRHVRPGRPASLNGIRWAKSSRLPAARQSKGHFAHHK